MKESLKETIKEKYRSIIDLAGMEGKFQQKVFIIFVLASYISGMTCTLMPLHKISPDYICGTNDVFAGKKYINGEIYSDIDKYKLIDDDKCVNQYCQKENKHINNILIVDTESSINHITELDLFCDSENFFLIFTQVVFFGRMIGILIHSFISDKYGRAMSLYVQLCLQLGCIVLSYFFKYRYLAYILAFLSYTCMSLLNHACLMSTEMMGEKMYSLVAGFANFAFSLNGLINTGIIYYFRDWNFILLYHFGITVYILYMCRFYMTETPLFLLENGNYRQFRKTMKQINMINNGESNKTQSETFLKALSEVQSMQKADNSACDFRNKIQNKSLLEPYLNILHSWKYISDIIKFSAILSSVLIIYYGQLLYVEDLPGNIFFNLFVIYTTEIFIELVASYICQIFGDNKKLLLSICCLSSGIFSFSIILFYNFQVLVTINIFLLTCVNSIAYVAILVFMSESIDVNVKSVSISFCFIIAFLSILISPYLTMLFGNVYIVFGLLSILTFLYLLFLNK